MRRINQAGLDLIKEFESLRLKAYQDEKGIWTIGYGHTGPEVVKGLEISEDQAEDLLLNDLGTAERGVSEAIGDVAHNNQFAACVSLAFNIGVKAFNGSTLARYMRAGEVGLAADQFPRWKMAGDHVSAGLVRRRKEERKLFLTVDKGAPIVEPPEEPVVEPAPEVAPVVDPAPPPQQTVESGGTGTQIVTAPPVPTDAGKVAEIAAVEAHAGEPPVQATTGGSQSNWAAIIAAITAIPSAIWGVLTGNGEAAKWAFIAGGAVACIWLLRKLVLDLFRAWATSRPDRHNVR